MVLKKIVSGLQTGADQAGLRAAKQCGIATGGYAPARFMTDEGPREDLAILYGLIESKFGYAGRTDQNAKLGEVTLWFGRKSPGFYCTYGACQRNGKAFIANPNVDQIKRHFMTFSVVNIAGNRERLNPGIGDTVYNLITCAINELNQLTSHHTN